MKWQLKEPRFGDMVRVAVGQIYHYGIFVSDLCTKNDIPYNRGKGTLTYVGAFLLAESK